MAAPAPVDPVVEQLARSIAVQQGEQYEVKPAVFQTLARWQLKGQLSTHAGGDNAELEARIKAEQAQVQMKAASWASQNRTLLIAGGVAAAALLAFLFLKRT